jgi:hypothetical protein
MYYSIPGGGRFFLYKKFFIFMKIQMNIHIFSYGRSIWMDDDGIFYKKRGRMDGFFTNEYIIK